MDRKTKFVVIGILILWVSLTGVIYALNVSQVVRTSGVVSNMGVYWDPNCFNAVTSIDWGVTISPSDVIEKIIYIKNVASVPMTLKASTTAWNPAYLMDYMLLVFGGENVTIAADFVYQTNLTLFVFENVTTSSPLISAFAFNVAINGN